MPDDAERERHVVVRVDVDARTARRARGFEQRRQLLQALGAEHDVDRAIAFEKRRAFLLCHASGDGDDRPLRLARRGLAQLAESRVELLLGALAHAAGVDDEHVGVALVFGARVAVALEKTRQAFRVMEVHLAAEGVDEVLTLGHVAPSLSFPRVFRLSTFFRFRPIRGAIPAAPAQTPAPEATRSLPRSSAQSPLPCRHRRGE